MIARATGWLHGKPIDRVLANWEPLVILAAKMRERWGIPGMSVDTVNGFRDKQLMKERVAAAGLRVPRSRRVTTESETRAAAEEIGYPLVLKPIAGAGSADTYRCADRQELDDALDKMGNVTVASLEEYIEGEEYTYDTVCVDGVPACTRTSRAICLPLEARSYEWISPVVISVRDLAQPKLAGGIELGRKVLKALDMGDGFTHMEWFLTAKGEAVFGEIGCRPRRRRPRRSDELHVRRRLLPRVGARRVLEELRRLARSQVLLGDHLQAREGPRPHLAHRRAQRVRAEVRALHQRREPVAARHAASRLEADALERRLHPAAPPLIGMPRTRCAWKPRPTSRSTRSDHARCLIALALVGCAGLISLQDVGVDAQRDVTHAGWVRVRSVRYGVSLMLPGTPRVLEESRRRAPASRRRRAHACSIPQRVAATKCACSAPRVRMMRHACVRRVG